MTKPRKPRRRRPLHLDPPSLYALWMPHTPDPEPLPEWMRNDPAALRAAMTLLLRAPGPDISSLFPCLTDREESNRHGRRQKR